VSRIGLVATDLDGSLLDRETHEYDAARPALDALCLAGVPLVLVTAKTHAEMAALGPALGASAVVVENGGAVAAGSWGLVLGARRERLLEALPAVAGEAGVRVRPFATMSIGEVVALTGLAPAAAALAMRREHDEPFLVAGAVGRDPALDARLDAAARARGLRVTHGGRLHHLSGPVDKGDALRALVAAWPGGIEGPIVGLGDAANDLPLLLAVDRPIVMPGSEGVIDPALASPLYGRERAPAPGPAGWSAAVLAALRGEPLPRVEA
jgi:mannosyl-3-phosphoglycerate phosphatase